MAVTERAVAASRESEDGGSGPRTSRRSLFSRLSTGHVLMILAGIVAAILNFSLLRSMSDTVAVAVAESEIQAGDVLTSASFSSAAIDADDDFLDVLIRTEDIERYDGFVATSRVAPGEPVTTSDLREPAAGSALRAMSIPIEPAHAAGGNLRAGDRVDVIWVVDGEAYFIATDIEALDVGDAGSGGALGGISPYSVTVAVDAPTALRLAAAIVAGDMELVRATGAEPASVTDLPERSTSASGNAAGEAEPQPTDAATDAG